MLGVAVVTVGVVGAVLVIGGAIRLVEWFRDRWDEAAAAIGL